MLPITFQSSVTAVAQVFAMGAMGFYLVRSGAVKETGLKLLSFLTINIFFPLFIFNQIISHFDPVRMPYWWKFPLINITLALTGLAVSSLVAWRRQGPMRDGFVAVSSLHNAGYIPLLILTSLPLGALAGPIYTYVILSIIGFDLSLWSLGMWLMTREKGGRMDLMKMINPPLVSMVTALSIILLFGPGSLPEAVLKPIKVLGDATLAMAMIVIGGNLGLTSLAKIEGDRVAAASLIKLVVLPMITLIVLSRVNLNPLIGFVAILQATMPSSVTLSIIGRNYETKNQDFINQTIFVTHVLSMVTMPIFLGLYGKISG